MVVANSTSLLDRNSNKKEYIYEEVIFVNHYLHN